MVLIPSIHHLNVGNVSLSNCTISMLLKIQILHSTASFAISVWYFIKFFGVDRRSSMLFPSFCLQVSIACLVCLFVYTHNKNIARIWQDTARLRINCHMLVIYVWLDTLSSLSSHELWQTFHQSNPAFKRPSIHSRPA